MLWRLDNYADIRLRVGVIVLLAGLVLSGCGGTAPPREGGQPEYEYAGPVPSALKIKYLPKGVQLTWQTNRGDTDAISGYNIYLSAEESLVGRAPETPEMQRTLWRAQTYPGDVDARVDVETAALTDVEFGVEYFVHIRTVMADGSIGPPSEEISFIPRPEGRIELWERFKNKQDGYNFDEQIYVRTKDRRNDLYIFVRSDSAFAASPHRLDQTLRYTEFYELGPSATIADYPTWEERGKGKTSIHLQEGISYILSTPLNCLAKFRVAGIRKQDGRTVVDLDYIYQTRCGVGVF